VFYVTHCLHQTTQNIVYTFWKEFWIIWLAFPRLPFRWILKKVMARQLSKARALRGVKIWLTAYCGRNEKKNVRAIKQCVYSSYNLRTAGAIGGTHTSEGNTDYRSSCKSKIWLTAYRNAPLYYALGSNGGTHKQRKQRRASFSQPRF